MDQATHDELSSKIVAPETRRLIWVAVACWLAINLGPSLVSLMKAGPQPGRPYFVPDFFADYASARNFLENRDVYTPHEQTLRRYLHGSSTGAPTFRYNVHPPSSVLLAVPLAWLGFSSAFLFWNVLSLACIAGALWIIQRELELAATVWSIFPAISLLMVYTPLWDQVRMGQLSALLLLLLTGAWSALRSGRPILSGSLLAVAASVKLFPGFLFLYLLFQRRWRSLAAGLVALDVITVLTASILGWDAYRSYLTQVLPEAQWYRVLWGNLSLPGFWSRLFESIPTFAGTLVHARPVIESPSIFWIALTASAVTVLFLLAWVSMGQNSREHFDLGYACAIIAMLLLSPVTWSHSLLMLILPILIFWRRRSSVSGRVLLVGLVILISVDPKISWSLIARDGGSPETTPLGSLVVASLACYALLGLLVMGLTEALRLQRAATRSITTAD